MELDNTHFMKQAIKLAIQAAEEGEVPIGAVVVADERIIGRGYNQTKKLADSTAHAEMLAMTAAFQSLNSIILSDCKLYVTIEPCAMCAGAIHWARFGEVIYGASEPKSGFEKFNPSILHPKTKITKGILEEECTMLIQQFFESKRD
jgi:tRNA(adenine34) deaminase